jgi:hypothetical protein
MVFVVTFRAASSTHLHFSSNLSGSGSIAPNSTAYSSWWYIVATFPSFKRSTTKRLSCCGVVLLARLIVPQFYDHKHAVLIYVYTSPRLYVDEVRKMTSVDQAVFNLVADAAVW